MKVIFMNKKKPKLKRRNMILIIRRQILIQEILKNIISHMIGMINICMTEIVIMISMINQTEIMTDKEGKNIMIVNIKQLPQ